MQACVKLLCHYQVLWLKCMAWILKMEGDYHQQRWTMWFLWKEGIKTVTCSAGYRASTGMETMQAAVHEWYQYTHKE